MLHQLPGAFTLTAGHTQLKLPDITHQRGNTFRDRQRATAFVQHVVCRQRERIIIGETALWVMRCAVSSSGYQNMAANRNAGFTRISL